MIHRYFLTAIFTLTLLPFTLRGQILDDYWQSGFQLPGFPRLVKDAGVTERGTVVVSTGGALESDVSPYFYYSDGDWQHLSLSLDTVQVGIDRVVIDGIPSTALTPGGEILAAGRAVITNEDLTLIFDQERNRWRKLLPGSLISVVYGQDGYCYSPGYDGATKRLLILRSDGMSIDTVGSGLPPPVSDRCLRKFYPVSFQCVRLALLTSERTFGEAERRASRFFR